MKHGVGWRCASPGDTPLDLREIVVRPVRSCDEPRYQELMRQHHYLGALPKISETLWYVATWREEWVALLSFSASALKCAARDRWIGWNFRQRYSRLKLIVNNSRFLILPDVASLPTWGRGFCRSAKGVWRAIGKQPSVMGWCCWKPLSTRSVFAGPCIGRRTGCTSGTRRDFAARACGYTATPQSPKMVFVQPLRADARAVAVPSRSSSPLSNRRFQNHAQRRADAIPPRVFPRDSRSPPRPRTAPWLVHGAGHRRRGRPVRHARLPGDRRLGRKVSGRKRASASAAVAKRAATSCPASRSSATC